MTLKKKPAPKPGEWKIKPNASYFNRWHATHITPAGNEGAEVEWGYEILGLDRTCSARELGAFWISLNIKNLQSIGPIAKYVREDLANMNEDYGVFITFQHQPIFIDFLKKVGFEEFCQYLGNEAEIVHGLCLVIRDMDWKYEEDFGDDDDDYDDDF